MPFDSQKYPLLSRIDSPNDVKELDSANRKELACELRSFIIESISKTGGHLAPSLGVIELTIALLSLYSPPFDKIVWDVGHQTYAYKILTGRRDRFDTLRQKNGISGFPKLSESKFDAFGVGHASTSIGAALGMATARDIKGEDYRVIAVIGDGALTGGIAFEGINNAGASGRDMLVILNDNEMSISKNVGALSRYLTEIITANRYRKIKDNIWDLTGKVPLTDKLRYIGQKLEDSAKSLITVQPGMFFEGLGFDYFGPIDGHNIDEVIKVLHDVHEVKGPKILHLLTRKGKGYEPAEADACKFHGIGSFDPETGEKYIDISSSPTYTSVFGDSMIEIAEEFDNLCAITAAMETGTGLDKFHRAFPERFFDVGIAEGHAILFGASLELSGIPTVTAIYSSFLQRSLDQIIHDVALQKIPLTIALDRAGIVGEDGPTHHGVFDLSFLRGIPGLIIAAPRDDEELRQLLFTAISYKNGPFVIRYPRCAAPKRGKREPLSRIPIGTWEILREGDSAAIIAVGSMVQTSVEVAEKLACEGIEIEVVNARFVAPIDESLLSKILKRHNRIVVIEENILTGGFGEGVASFALQRKWVGEFHHLGIPDYFIEHARRDELLDSIGLDKAGILRSIENILHD